MLLRILAPKNKSDIYNFPKVGVIFFEPCKTGSDPDKASWPVWSQAPKTSIVLAVHKSSQIWYKISQDNNVMFLNINHFIGKMSFGLLMVLAGFCETVEHTTSQTILPAFITK